MATKFVVRLLDPDDQLLAWTTVWADPKPQEGRASCPFWPTGATQFAIEQAGVVTRMSVHWCDLDIARVSQPMEPTAVQVGQVFTFAWLEPVWLVAGMRDVPVPPVTVRESVTLVVPTGSLTAVTL